MLKTIASFVALILVGAAIYFLTYTPRVRLVLACNSDEKCVDLYGKPSMGVGLGAIHWWGVGRAEDLSGHCRNGCTIKTIYDQAGDQNLTQEDVTKRPPYCDDGSLCLAPPHS
jgi:hypothetical protein